MRNMEKSWESRESFSLILWKSGARCFQSWVTVLTFLANLEYLCPALGFVLPVQMSFSSCSSISILQFTKPSVNHSLSSSSNNVYMLLGRTKMFHNAYKTESFYFSHGYVLNSFQCFISLNCTSSPTKIFKLSAPKFCNGSNGRHQEVKPFRSLKCSHFIV